MVCERCNTNLPGGARFCSHCGAPAPTQPTGVNTGGGGYFGNVQAANVAGRNQYIGGNAIQTNQQGVQAQDLAALFRAVYEQIETHASKHPDADPELLIETANRIEQEAAKGDEADAAKLRRWLGTLVKIAPDVAATAVNALTNPVAAVASGVKAVAGLFSAATAPAEDESDG